MNRIPLVERDPQDPFARLGDHIISVGEFCADVQVVADILPDTRFVVNLCQERYTFTVCFFAALARETTNLLPARREPQFARTLGASYESSCIVGEEKTEGVDIVISLNPGSNGTCSSPSVSGKHVAAIVFTSGSTGEPQAHAKSWQMLDTWRHVHWRYLPGEREQPRGLVATVPSWHMYGLEWALLLPTIAPLTLHCGADFYPQTLPLLWLASNNPASSSQRRCICEQCASSPSHPPTWLRSCQPPHPWTIS